MNQWQTSLIALALATLPAAGFAQGEYPTTTASFAEPLLVGMKLSVNHGAASGQASEKRAQCVNGLSQDSFAPVVSALLPRYLSASDLRVAEAFFSGTVGRKYVRHGILQLYQSVGEPLPSPSPTFTDAEYRELEAFAATRAGEQLVKNRVLQSGEARQAYDGRIRELLAKCPN